MVYILALLISTCLILGQTSWGSAVKNIAPIGSSIGTFDLLTKMALSPKFWLGVTFYLAGTAIYFLLLSKVRFFSVQITMTGLAIVFSVLIAHFFFKEPVSLINLAGVAMVLSGIMLVFR